MTGSNRRPPACKAGALPAELIPRPEDRGQGTEDRHFRIALCAMPLFLSPVVCHLSSGGGSGWARTNDPRLIKTVL